ncbi:MAG: DUF2306 domain-containing protein [Phycisphaerales bacterium]|nr:DUF2306 domain-containing protein [Phycisphaerales bacterium]
MALSAWGVVGYAAFAYGVRPAGSTVHPAMMDVYQREPWGILTHVFGSAIALLIGPLQFVGGLRSRAPAVHRTLGKAYLALGVLPGGLAGMYMAFHSFGGWIAHSGFVVLAVVWLWTAWLAYAAARRRDFAAHRAWMVRNFALTFAAVVLRVQLVGVASTGVRIEQFYHWLAWTSWVPNVLVAEWLVRNVKGGRGD